ncbi:MAG TPA: type II toxin-antitoxin system VapC family toxin [Polyangiales bacterium]|jgi:PIN domain nuclease of toxin-antitoxin system|nr:type II toxin-antitoxin system VapC family toxin [Polyangiales bacterium]
MLLLDTHTWVWLAVEPRRLSKEAAGAIRRAASRGELAIAAITLWEVAMLFARGRLKASRTLEKELAALVERTSVAVLEVTPAVAAIAAQLPDDVPDDPADRMIIATAMSHGLSLVTKDARIQDSGACRTIW